MDKADDRIPDAHDLFAAGDRAAEGMTVSEFWRWAYSDFTSNTIRGVLAEYIVAGALGCPLVGGRDAWADYDLKTPDGLLIEVKATGYLQAWESRGSRPCFTGLRGQRLTEDRASYEGPAVVRAHVFVFCVQTAKIREEYQPLNLDQWAFYVVSAKAIDETGQKSIGLAAVERLGRRATFQTLKEVVGAARTGAELVRLAPLPGATSG